jgi:hypothetical protein
VPVSGAQVSDTERRRTAHADLKAWLVGDHVSNNTYR